MKSTHDPRYLEIIARIRGAREHQQLSQAQLATLLGKPQSYVAKIETGERRLDLIEALAICEAMRIPLEEITPTGLQHLLRSEAVGARHARD